MMVALQTIAHMLKVIRQWCSLQLHFHLPLQPFQQVRHPYRRFLLLQQCHLSQPPVQQRPCLRRLLLRHCLQQLVQPPVQLLVLRQCLIPPQIDSSSACIGIKIISGKKRRRKRGGAGNVRMGNVKTGRPLRLIIAVAPTTLNITSVTKPIDQQIIQISA